MDVDNTNNEDLIKELKRLRRQNKELREQAINLSKAAIHLSNKETSWIYAIEGNRDGVWDWNAVTNEVFFSRRWKEMLGFEMDEITDHLSEWDKRVHPDDRDAVYISLDSHLNGESSFYQNEHRVQCKDGSYKWILDRGKIFSWTEDGKPERIVGTHTDITLRKEAETENQHLLKELADALDKVKQLSGFLPICSSCKNIRDDKGYWNKIEKYISTHSEAEFSHGICPECARKLYPEFNIR